MCIQADVGIPCRPTRRSTSCFIKNYLSDSFFVNFCLRFGGRRRFAISSIAVRRLCTSLGFDLPRPSMHVSNYAATYLRENQLEAHITERIICKLVAVTREGIIACRTLRRTLRAIFACTFELTGIMRCLFEAYAPHRSAAYIYTTCVSLETA